MSQLSPELFRDLVEFAPDALIVVGAEGTILYANTHAHTLFGYAANQLTGISVEQLIPLESRSQHAAHRVAYQQAPQLREMGNRNMALFGLRRDGTRFRAEIRLAPIKTPYGYVAAAAVRDATESVQFTSMLAAARQTAEEANEAKGRLLAAASHDLRQPMQTLRLLNGAMKRLAIDPTVKDALLQEERALNTMSELLHALLNIAKLESGTLQPTLTDVSLRTLFEDLRQQFAALAKLKQLELVVVTPDLHLRTDAVLLSELLQNLLANALRYTDQGRVTLSCVPLGASRALLEVADTGIGIPAASVGKIFEDFFQITGRGDGHRGGAGLGLGIVRRLSKLLDIPIEVTSTVGVGTRFSMDIATLTQPQCEPQERSGTIAHHRNQRILLVEDDRSMRDALRTYLKLDEHEVHTAGSLQELSEVLSTLSSAPSILISDFHLGPNERGSDAIEKVRARYSRAIPAILLTGDTSAVPARFSHEAGVRMLNKPVDTQRLVSLIDELLQTNSGAAH